MKPKITLFIFCLLVLSFIISGCSHLKDNQPDKKVITINDIKSDSWRSFIGKTIVVEGFFVDRPTPMLLNSMELLNINTKLREKDYIRLTGEGIKNLNPEKYYGAYVHFQGTVSVSKDNDTKRMAGKFGEIYAIELFCAEKPEIVRVRDESLIIPEFIDFCRKYPKICDRIVEIDQNKYALLISGGIDSTHAYSRYWNDLSFMYNTLKSKYGFSDKNILVVYKDGVAVDNSMNVDYAADSDGIDDAFGYLYENMSSTDLFVLFTTNHGGGFRMDAYYEDGVHTVDDMLCGGRIDESGDESDEAIFEEHLFTDLNSDGDENDQVRYDEVLYLYHETDDLWDDDLAEYINKLKYNRMLIIMEQCFSGGFIADLRGKNRVIVSASSEYEFSYGGGPGNHDMFSYYFTSALAGEDHQGNSINADSNNDGNVSVLEAFEYAQTNDTADETPFYEDSGDGRGHDSSFPQDKDGKLGKSFFLH